MLEYRGKMPLPHMFWQLLPESCMKINAKFRMPFMAARQANYRNTTKDLFGIMDEIILSH
jgi:hypothetical protein